MTWVVAPELSLVPGTLSVPKLKTRAVYDPVGDSLPSKGLKKKKWRA